MEVQLGGEASPLAVADWVGQDDLDSPSCDLASCVVPSYFAETWLLAGPTAGPPLCPHWQQTAAAAAVAIAAVGDVAAAAVKAAVAECVAAVGTVAAEY